MSTSALRALALAAGLVALVACATTAGRLKPAAHPLAYRFELEGAFNTTLTPRDGGAPEVFPEERLQLWGTVERSEAREFRDGSIGHLVRFGEVETATSADGPRSRSELSAKSIELRTFGDGEILDIDLLEHISGPPRYGDTFDVLLVALSPVVPQVAEGAEAWRRLSWPFLLEKGQGARTSLSATWRNEGVREVAGQQEVAVAYQGPLEGKGEDNRFRGALAISGQAEGRVVLELPRARVLEHTFSWERTLDYRFPGADVAQRQQVRGRLVREGRP